MSLLQKIRNILQNRSGAVAVEFALIVPILLLIYVGSVELSIRFEAIRKMSRATRVIADLISQEKDINAEKFADIEHAIETLLFPYPIGDYGLVVSNIKVSTGNDPDWEVLWSKKIGKLTSVQPRAKGKASDLPNVATLPTDSSALISEAKFHFRSPVAFLSSQREHILTDSIYTWPRTLGDVDCTGC